jgi:hypothetical protein
MLIGFAGLGCVGYVQRQKLAGAAGVIAANAEQRERRTQR